MVRHCWNQATERWPRGHPDRVRQVNGRRMTIRRDGSRWLGTLLGLSLPVAGWTAGSAAPSELSAQNTEADSLSLAELQQRVEILTLEIEELRLGSDVVARADTTVLGFGPAASKVYEVTQGVSIGGYGEIVYENFSDTREDGSPSGKTDKVDALRGIIYAGYKFDDRFLFNSEIEIEHASTGQAGSASLEFAYLDYRVTESFGLRGGLLLSPMGFVNELHEPPIILGAKRPATESQIIPTTWRENGVGIFGEIGSVSYRAYLMNSLDAVGGGSSKAAGFSASGVRGGRQKGSKAVAESFSVVGRVDWTGILGLTAGTSLYVGNSGHGRALASGTVVDARTLIWEGHVGYQARGLDVRALLAVADVDDVAALNELKSLSDSSSIGERLQGGYVQVGYDLLNRSTTTHQLIPFLRYESVDTQSQVPVGFASNPANDGTSLTLGLSWKPLPQIVGKADYQLYKNEAGSGVDQFNVALGYLF